VFSIKLLVNVLFKASAESEAAKQDAYRSASVLKVIALQMFDSEDLHFKQIKQCLEEVSSLYENRIQGNLDSASKSDQ
jgi:hypothetical protein